jgi:hypothetical protein
MMKLLSREKDNYRPMKKLLLILFFLSAASSAHALGMKGSFSTKGFFAVKSGGSPVAEVMISTDLVAYWKLDEGSGSTTADSTGTFTGTLQNTPTWETLGCKSGNCMSFASASSEYVSIVNDPVVGDKTKFTVCGWVKTTDSNTVTIYGEGRSSTGNPLIKLAVNEDVAGDVSFQYRDDGFVAGSTVTIGLSANDGNWHYICGVQESKSSRKLYMDGTLRATETSTVGTLTLDRSNIGVFERTTLTNYMNGTLDQIRVYKQALTSGEINTIYSAGQ